VTLDTQKIRLIMTLRDAGITDPRVLGALETVPRELFVPDYLRERAYDNTALPIGQGQTISQPVVVAMMTQALDIGPRMSVLEIGTGSGYQTAILARLCRRVYTIEYHAALMREAEERFDRLKLRNITTRVGDGSNGWREAAPFDRILAAAAAPVVPEALAEQLSEGGIMVLPIGEEGGVQDLVSLRKTGSGLERTSLGAVQFVPFVGEVQARPRDGGVRRSGR
jgi:protein-L-isoaspartate(D-aspartate) O-methyltransferase